MRTYLISIIPKYHGIKRWYICDKCPVDIDKAIGRGMVSVLNSTAGVCGFELWSHQNKDYKIGICYFSAMHASLRDKHKEWWVWYQDQFD